LPELLLELLGEKGQGGDPIETVEEAGNAAASVTHNIADIIETVRGLAKELKQDELDASNEAIERTSFLTKALEKIKEGTNEKKCIIIASDIEGDWQTELVNPEPVETVTLELNGQPIDFAVFIFESGKYLRLGPGARWNDDTLVYWPPQGRKNQDINLHFEFDKLE
jgi:hypothetical protein